MVNPSRYRSDGSQDSSFSLNSLSNVSKVSTRKEDAKAALFPLLSLQAVVEYIIIFSRDVEIKFGAKQLAFVLVALTIVSIKIKRGGEWERRIRDKHRHHLGCHHRHQ